MDGSQQAANRLRIALELAELAEVMQEQNLRRRHPGASDVEIEQLLQEWFARRPGAEHGDAWGTPVAWPRPAVGDRS